MVGLGLAGWAAPGMAVAASVERASDSRPEASLGVSHSAGKPFRLSSQQRLEANMKAQGGMIKGADQQLKAAATKLNAAVELYRMTEEEISREQAGGTKVPRALQEKLRILGENRAMAVKVFEMRQNRYDRLSGRYMRFQAQLERLRKEQLDVLPTGDLPSPPMVETQRPAAAVVTAEEARRRPVSGSGSESQAEAEAEVAVSTLRPQRQVQTIVKHNNPRIPAAISIPPSGHQQQGELELPHSEPQIAMLSSGKRYAREQLRLLKRRLVEANNVPEPFAEAPEIKVANPIGSEFRRLSVFQYLDNSQYQLSSSLQGGEQEFAIGELRWRLRIPEGDDGEEFVFLLDARELADPKLVFFKRSLFE